MKHIVVALLISLSGVNPAFADTKNDCKLDVMLAPEPFGIGMRNRPDVTEVQRPIAQRLIDIFDNLYEMGGENYIELLMLDLIASNSISEETAMHVMSGYLTCELSDLR